MSGTSADGIDAVVAELSGSGRGMKAHLVAHRHQRFAPALRQHILHVCLHGTVAEICELNFLLGEHFARAALGVVRKAGLKPRDIAAIGSHGQTIHHLPSAKTPSTLQIGEPSVIAERTGITTVADFRVRDMAAGGQGAPLVPYADWVLFTSPIRPRILQNIGGIGNLTFLPPAADLDEVQAFDTGPGNMVIDGVAQELSGGKLACDRDGLWAARGRVCEKLLKAWLAHPFLKRRPPKTTGREEFGEMFLRQVLADSRRSRLSDYDTLATVTALTAASIAEAYRRFVFPAVSPTAVTRTQVVLAGGGAKNPVLRGMIAERIAPAKLCRVEDFGVSSESKEALAFAILAHETLRGVPANVPRATGARRAVVLGKVMPGGEGTSPPTAPTGAKTRK
jgi:anhydro-N-acetylmuramic acid kinase